jgi:hypothetical protein
LDVNNQLGLAEPLSQTVVLPLEVGDPLGQWVRHPRSAPPCPGPQTLQGAFFPLLPPQDQVRGVQTLTTQQLAKLPTLVTGIGFLQDSQFVPGRELPPACLLGHLGISDHDLGHGRRRGSFCPRPSSGSTGLATLARRPLHQAGGRSWES